MGKRPKRKIVLFIVEGLSEIEALTSGMRALYNYVAPEAEVFFAQIVSEDETGGDLTTWPGANPASITYLIDGLVVKPFLRENGFYAKDLCEIIQIVDLDGAFIPDEALIHSPSLSDGKLYYGQTGIATANTEKTARRNQIKRCNIERLLSLSAVKIQSKQIPYSLYYFSSNLDHFLYGTSNLEPELKVAKAREFAKTYGNDRKLFTRWFSKTEQSAEKMSSFEMSWDYVRKGLHSLERHTNIFILFRELYAAKTANAKIIPFVLPTNNQPDSNAISTIKRGKV